MSDEVGEKVVDFLLGRRITGDGVEEEGAHMAAEVWEGWLVLWESVRAEGGELTFGDGLDQASEDEGEIVAWVEAMPKSTGSERNQAGPEAWLFAPGCYSEVDRVPQPVVGVHVPTGEISTRVLRKLNLPRVDVLQAVPRHLGGNGVEAVVPHASEDTSPLAERPDGVVLEAGNDIGHVVEPDTLENPVLEEGIAGEELRVVLGSEDDEENKPYEAAGGFTCGGSATAWDLALLTDGGLLRGIDLRGDVKHGAVNPALVISVVKSWTGPERWEEEHPGGVVKNGRYILEHTVLLVV